MMVGRPDLMAAELSVSSSTDPETMNNRNVGTDSSNNNTFTLLKLSQDVQKRT